MILKVLNVLKVLYSLFMYSCTHVLGLWSSEVKISWSFHCEEYPFYPASDIERQPLSALLLFLLLLECIRAREK